MTVFLCNACGTSYPDAEAPPAACPICEDERQYIPASGQGWTTQQALTTSRRNAWHQHERGLFNIHTVPAFAINQRAFLICTPAGNVMWDCIAHLDTATKNLVRALGGITAIAISHPHYYTTMQDWAAEFGAPVYLHSADREWVMRPDPAIELWDGDNRELLPGVNLVRLGGHFSGGTVLHWSGSHDGKGVLLAGDILQVTPGARRVSFMWSYPNMMPLAAEEIRRIRRRLRNWAYDRLYGAFLGQDVPQNAEEIVARSASRYIELLESTPDGG